MVRRLSILVAMALVVISCSDAAGDQQAPSSLGTETSLSTDTSSSSPTTGAPTVLPPLLREVASSWGTDWEKRSIELEELRVGVMMRDPRDVIPPLDAPEFVDPVDAGIPDREPGILVRVGSDARFYPLRILNLHEVVNDVVGGEAIAVTYCPLCNSAVAFRRTLRGMILDFGTSGLLRNSDLVMWDRATESLWQQITGEAIVGELSGSRLEMIPSAIVSMADFAAEYPDGLVLSQETGIYRGYGVNPYTSYSTGDRPLPGLFVGEIDDRLPALQRVAGVHAGGEDVAYPFPAVEEAGAINDVVGGEPVVVLWGAPDTADPLDTGRIADGRAIGAVLAFSRRVDGDTLSFSPNGAGGFVDEQTGSTWNLLGRAVDGRWEGRTLQPVLHTNEFWFAWAAFHATGRLYAAEPG